MDINFICTRKRREFGKPCAFVDIDRRLIVEIDPNPSIREKFCRLPTVDRQIDNSKKMCAHEVNTLTFPTESRGMNHVEGGWPAAVDNTDEESMARFRKKIEKDKGYVNTVKSLADFLENYIMQTNSIDIYEEYFEGERIKRDTNWSVRAISVFQDLNENYRSVVDLSWEKDSTKFAAIYEPKKSVQAPLSTCIESYVWDVENNATPIYNMKPEVSMTVVEFSPTDNNLILSGYINGQVALWDIRTREQVHQLSTVTCSHTQKVTGVKWLKQDTAFFSASSDGKLMSWDTRNLSSPTETVHLDTEKDDILNLDQNYAISCIEFDITLPHKFMVGTEEGVVLSFNRKVKQAEDKLSSRYDCKYGSLLAVERNAFYPQLFVSCDAWSLKLWTDGVTDAPILNIVSQDGYFTDISWSPTRASTMFATKTTGVLEIWDIPGKSKEALLNIKLDNEGLLSVDINETGNRIICGSLSGSVQLLNVPEYLRENSEEEKDLLKECIRESETVLGGNPRSIRVLEQQPDDSSEKGIEEWWDPPDKAEDLYEEYKELFKDFPSEVDAN